MRAADYFAPRFRARILSSQYLEPPSQGLSCLTGCGRQRQFAQLIRFQTLSRAFLSSRYYNMLRIDNRNYSIQPARSRMAASMKKVLHTGRVGKPSCFDDDSIELLHDEAVCLKFLSSRPHCAADAAIVHLEDLFIRLISEEPKPCRCQFRRIHSRSPSAFCPRFSFKDLEGRLARSKSNRENVTGTRYHLCHRHLAACHLCFCSFLLFSVLFCSVLLFLFFFVCFHFYSFLKKIRSSAHHHAQLLHLSMLAELGAPVDAKG